MKIIAKELIGRKKIKVRFEPQKDVRQYLDLGEEEIIKFDTVGQLAETGDILFWKNSDGNTYVVHPKIEVEIYN